MALVKKYTEMMDRLLTDGEMRNALYELEWKVIIHKREQHPRTNMNVHALYINDSMFGYILDKPEEEDWYSIYKGNREYAHSTISKHSLDEAKQALFDMALPTMKLPPERGITTQAQDIKTLKAVGEWLERILEDSFVMAYAGEDEPYESTIDPITIREIIDQLKQGKMPEAAPETPE